MALNLTNLFTALGRAGRNAYILNGAQVLQPVPFDSLVGYAYINPAWITQLTQGYDSAIRTGPGAGMPQWVAAAQQILLSMVTAENPAYGSSLPSALQFLHQEMVAQAASVREYTIGAPSIVADPANVGNGALFITTTRGDGVSLQNTVAEETVLLITSDSYTGGQTAGREPWQWNGAPNISSLGTGVPVGLWDWDWPTGSGGSATGQCISASQYATTSGNYLTNGDFATWTGGTPVPSYWNLVVGTWGVTIQRNAVEYLSSPYSVEFIAGATLNELTQQFGSGSTVSGATAGTPAALTAFKGYAANVWLKAAGVITGGVLSISWVDSSGTVLNDQSGAAQTQTIALAAHPTSWTAHPVPLRLPVILPTDGIVRLRIKITTALSGANLYMDNVALCQPTNLYAGGPNACLFSNPTAPFEAAPDPDGYTITFTNNRGGALYGASWQTLINRLFQSPDLILPYSGAPTIADTLITAV